MSRLTGSASARLPGGGQYGPAASKADLLTCLSDLESLQIRRPYDGAVDRVVGLDNVMLNAGPATQ